MRVTKAAIDPVWHLPGIARRFDVAEGQLRRVLFEQTGGMFPELVTRPDLHVFLPPIGGMTLYFFGDIGALGHAATKVACRVHDECNGSDVFGSDICTCRPYLAHGVEVCIEMAQQGGVGLVVYNRKEGRALGEVTKFLVYNARKRQVGGDRAATYFERTECVAGVQDMRFQELMPDVFHWLGIARIDRWASMSNMKHDALTAQGIAVGEQVAIPDDLIPADARVEMDAKKAAGYYAPRRRRTCRTECSPRAARSTSDREAPGSFAAREAQRPLAPRARPLRDAIGGIRRFRIRIPRPRLLTASAVRTRCASDHGGGRTRGYAAPCVAAGTDRGSRGVCRRHHPRSAIRLSTFRTTAAGGISKRAASIAGRDLRRIAR